MAPSISYIEPSPRSDVGFLHNRRSAPPERGGTPGREGAAPARAPGGTTAGDRTSAPFRGGDVAGSFVGPGRSGPSQSLFLRQRHSRASPGRTDDARGDRLAHRRPARAAP